MKGKKEDCILENVKCEMSAEKQRSYKKSLKRNEIFPTKRGDGWLNNKRMEIGLILFLFVFVSNCI
jgi:hypothetical protein